MLSIEVDRPPYFAITLLILLATGELRILLTWVASRRMLEIERAFLLTTAGALVGILASLVILESVADSATRNAVLKGIVLGFTLARTSLQYVLAFEAYFPPD